MRNPSNIIAGGYVPASVMATLLCDLNAIGIMSIISAFTCQYPQTRSGIDIPAGWCALSQRQLAALAGKGRKTVATVLARIKNDGTLETQQLTSDGGETIVIMRVRDPAKENQNSAEVPHGVRVASDSAGTPAPASAEPMSQRPANPEPVVAPPAPRAARPARTREPKPVEYPDDFTAFWDAYPKRVGKGAAFDAWNKLTAADRARAVEVAPNYAARETSKQSYDPTYTPNPATWLNQRRFDDDAAVVVVPTRHPPGYYERSWLGEEAWAEMQRAAAEEEAMHATA